MFMCWFKIGDWSGSSPFVNGSASVFKHLIRAGGKNFFARMSGRIAARIPLRSLEKMLRRRMPKE